MKHIDFDVQILLPLRPDTSGTSEAGIDELSHEKSARHVCVPASLSLCGRGV